MTAEQQIKSETAHGRYDRSKALHERARKSLAGGVSSQFRTMNLPHPMFYTHARGSRIWDADGNELIDMTLAQGPCILGHSHPELIANVNAAIARGQLYAGQHLDELELAEALQRLVPSAELVRLGLSGSEAAHALLRLARHVTGKPKYVKFVGHYHGWFDNVSFSVSPPREQSNEAWRPVPWGGGIPASVAEDVIVLPWNDLETVEREVGRRAGEIGAIITEPVMCNQGCIEPAPGFLEGLREICDRHDIALIFDEIIAGFRLELGGGQVRYGVTPDLAMFGKALGAGFPISALVGKERFMRPLATGEVYHAGTLNGGNASVAAALTAIDVLGRDGAAGHRHIVRLGTMLRDGIAEIAARASLPILVRGPGPMFHMGFTRRTRVEAYDDVLDYDRALYGAFCQKMLDRGVRLIERGLWYVSLAHTEDDVRVVLDAAAASIRELEQ